MSVSYAKIDLVGYTGGDPEPIESTNGVNGAKFSLAINRVWTTATGDPQEQADWYQIFAWNRLAETCLAHLKKGRLVFVTGKP